MSRAHTRIFLLRHGEVAEAWLGRIYGCLDVPLSTRGEEEARRSAQRLSAEPLARVVSSGLARTEHTAALLRAGRNLERIDDHALRELDRGRWAGLTLEELERADPGAWERWHRSPAALHAPGGESLGELASRVFSRLDHWARAHPGERIAVVTHGWVIRVVVCRASGLPLDSAPDLDVRTGDLFVLDWPANPDQIPILIESPLEQRSRTPRPDL